MAPHRHHDLEDDLARLTARVAHLEQEIRTMRALQAAARIMLGFDPNPPADDAPDR